MNITNSGVHRPPPAANSVLLRVFHPSKSSPPLPTGASRLFWVRRTSHRKSAATRGWKESVSWYVYWSSVAGKEGPPPSGAHCQPYQLWDVTGGDTQQSPNKDSYSLRWGRLWNPHQPWNHTQKSQMSGGACRATVLSPGASHGTYQS